MRPLIVAFVFAACLLLGSGSSQAQVSAVLLKCTKSLSVAVTCVVIDAGVAKAVDIGLDQLIMIARGCGKKVDASKFTPSKMSVSEVEPNGIAWGKLCEFLESIVKSKPKASAAEIREKAAAACATRFQPICRSLGFPEPRQEIPFGCNLRRTREVCDRSASCVWTGTSCSSGGTKKLFER